MSSRILLKKKRSINGGESMRRVTRVREEFEFYLCSWACSLFSYRCNFSFNVSFSRASSSCFSRAAISSVFRDSTSAESGPFAPMKRRTNSLALFGFSGSSYKATSAPKQQRKSGQSGTTTTIERRTCDGIDHATLLQVSTKLFAFRFVRTVGRRHCFSLRLSLANQEKQNSLLSVCN